MISRRGPRSGGNKMDMKWNWTPQGLHSQTEVIQVNLGVSCWHNVPDFPLQYWWRWRRVATHYNRVYRTGWRRSVRGRCKNTCLNRDRRTPSLPPWPDLISNLKICIDQKTAQTESTQWEQGEQEDTSGRTLVLANSGDCIWKYLSSRQEGLQKGSFQTKGWRRLWLLDVGTGLGTLAPWLVVQRWIWKGNMASKGTNRGLPQWTTGPSVDIHQVWVDSWGSEEYTQTKDRPSENILLFKDPSYGRLSIQISGSDFLQKPKGKLRSGLGIL